MFARLGVWLAAFALLSQSLALSAGPMPASDARSAAAELSALIGPGVIVCAQGDQPDKPTHHGGDCDLCPICRTAANAFVLHLPQIAPFDAPRPVFAGDLVAAPTPLTTPQPRQTRPHARAPPFLT